MLSGLLTWVSILITHICFRRARDVQRIDTAYIPFEAPLGTAGSYAALGLLIIIILTKGADVFVGQFDYKNFIVGYIGIPVYLVCILGYKLVKRSSRVTAAAADLVTGVPTVTVAEERAQFEAERKEKEALHSNSGVLVKFYKVTLAYLF